MKKYIIISSASFGLMILGSIIGNALESLGIVTRESIGPQGIKIIITIYFALFLVLVYATVPLLLRAFIVLQTRIGNEEFILIRFIKNNECTVTYYIWGILTLGIILMIPFGIKNWFS